MTPCNILFCKENNSAIFLIIRWCLLRLQAGPPRKFFHNDPLTYESAGEGGFCLLASLAQCRDLDHWNCGLLVPRERRGRKGYGQRASPVSTSAQQQRAVPVQGGQRGVEGENERETSKKGRIVQDPDPLELPRPSTQSVPAKTGPNRSETFRDRYLYSFLAMPLMISMSCWRVSNLGRLVIRNFCGPVTINTFFRMKASMAAEATVPGGSNSLSS